MLAAETGTGENCLLQRGQLESTQEKEEHAPFMTDPFGLLDFI